MLKYSAVRFDGQADTHDWRTGIPEQNCLEIARAVRSLSSAGKNELLLDLGAGTGLPGAFFPEMGFRYLGLDASRPMLELFAERRALCPGVVELGVTDIDKPWPVADRSVRVVFSSRAAHLFDRAHLVRETERVCEVPATFVLGRVRRPEGGLRRRLRDEMRARLVQRGFEPIDAGRAHRAIIDAFLERGGVALPAIVAAVWRSQHSASSVLHAWTKTSGLGGCELPPELKQEILNELWDWVEQNVESKDAATPCEERFVLEAVRLDPSARGCQSQ